MASTTEELNFQFDFTVMNLNGNSYMCSYGYSEGTELTWKECITSIVTFQLL